MTGIKNALPHVRPRVPFTESGARRAYRSQAAQSPVFGLSPEGYPVSVRERVP